jgi:hydrogenase maturation protease
MMLDTLVLGIGNILLQDEGLGVRALERLKQDYCVPSAIQLVDGGVMGLDLLPYLEDLSTLLVIDAVQTGQPPGTLVRLEGDAIPAALALKMSMHQAGLQELLATSRLQGTSPPKVVLWGMEPANVDWGLDLSAPVAARLDALVHAVVEELQDWGVWNDLPILDPPRHACRGGSTN